MTHLVDYGLAQAVVILVRNDSGDRTAAGTGTATGPSFDVGMWIGTGPLKPEHELTENAMDETWEEEEEEMEEEESIIETVELPGSGVDMTPEMMLEAGSRTESHRTVLTQKSGSI